MSAIVEAIKELREKTGAGMMDCRRAIEASGGNMDKAAALLSEQGLLHAQKRQDRETNEGRVFLQSNNHKAVILRLACETDFVARTTGFIRLGEECLALAFEGSAGEKELAPRIQEAVARTKENIVLRGLKTLSVGQGERLFTYVHGEGRIGVAISLAASDPSVWGRPEAQTLAADLALHVAAFGPLFLSRESVDPGYLQQKEVEFTGDAKLLGKPDRMLQGIVRGKMNKHFSKVCLLEQGFIRDETITVGGVLKKSGLDIQVRGFIYECVGK